MTHWKNDRPTDPWGLAAWLLVMAVLLLVLTGEALSPAPEPPTARERAARFSAQDRYYEVMDLYGDLTGATEAARLVYREVVQCSGS